MPLSINGVNHFAISVANIEESIAWYERVFGFTVLKRSTIPGVDINVCHMQGVGFQLEIFEAAHAHPLPPDRRVPNLDLMTLGNKHLSLGVADGKRAKAEVEAMGVEVVKVAEVDGTYGVFILDNTGNLIELFEEGTR